MNGNREILRLLNLIKLQVIILCKVFNAQRKVCIYLCIYFFDLIMILYKNVSKADSGNKCLEK